MEPLASDPFAGKANAAWPGPRPSLSGAAGEALDPFAFPNPDEPVEPPRPPSPSPKKPSSKPSKPPSHVSALQGQAEAPVALPHPNDPFHAAPDPEEEAPPPPPRPRTDPPRAPSPRTSGTNVPTVPAAPPRSKSAPPVVRPQTQSSENTIALRSANARASSERNPVVKVPPPGEATPAPPTTPSDAVDPHDVVANAPWFAEDIEQLPEAGAAFELGREVPALPEMLIDVSTQSGAPAQAAPPPKRRRWVVVAAAAALALTATGGVVGYRHLHPQTASPAPDVTAGLAFEAGPTEDAQATDVCSARMARSGREELARQILNAPLDGHSASAVRAHLEAVAVQVLRLRAFGRQAPSSLAGDGAALLSHLPETAAGTVDAIVAQALAEAVAGHIAQARAPLEALATARPDRGEVYAALGETCLIDNDYHCAADALAKAIAAEGPFPAWVWARGEALVALGEKPEGMREIRSAARGSPMLATAAVRYAELCLDQGNAPACVVDILDGPGCSMSGEPPWLRARAHSLLATAYEQRFQYARARDHYHWAQWWNQDDSSAAVGEARMLWQSGNADLARSALEEARPKAASSRDLLLLSVQALRQTQQRKLAVSQLAAYVARQSDDVEATLALTEERFREGDGGAVEKLLPLKALSPSTAAGRYVMARLKEWQAGPFAALTDATAAAALPDRRPGMVAYAVGLGLTLGAVTPEAALAQAQPLSTLKTREATLAVAQIVGRARIAQNDAVGAIAAIERGAAIAPDDGALLTLLSQAYRRGEMPEAAERTLAEALQRDFEGSAAVLEKVALLEKAGDLKGVHELLERAVISDPPDSRILTQHARLLDPAAVDKREKLLKQALALWPGNAQARTLLVNLLLTRQRFEEVRPHLASLAALPNPPPDMERFEGLLAKGEKDLTKAEEKLAHVCEAAAALAPDCMALAEVQSERKELGEALASCDRAAERGGAPGLDWLRASVLESLGAFSDAADTYARVAVSEPKSAKPRLAEGRALGRASKWKEAAEVLQSAQELDQRNEEILYWLGRAWYELKETAKSIRPLEQAIALNGSNAAFHVALAKSYAALATDEGRGAAMKEIDRALELAKDEPDALRVGATICGEWNNPTCAVAHLRALVRLKPNDGQLRVELGKWLLAAGARGDAVATLEEAAKLPFVRGEALYTLGTVYLNLADEDRALESFDQAIAASPKDARSYCRKGVLTADLKRYADAKKALQDCLNRSPPEDLRRAAAEAMEDVQAALGNH